MERRPRALSSLKIHITTPVKAPHLDFSQPYSARSRGLRANSSAPARFSDSSSRAERSRSRPGALWARLNALSFSPGPPLVRRNSGLSCFQFHPDAAANRRSDVARSVLSRAGSFPICSPHRDLAGLYYRRTLTASGLIERGQLSNSRARIESAALNPRDPA